jgi:alpha-N-arabinofuranosidase
MGDESLPAISASASRHQSGDILLTLCNLYPSTTLTLTCELNEFQCNSVLGSILSGDTITAHNTFDMPNRVQPTVFEGATLENPHLLKIQLPAASVIALTLMSS